MTFSQYAGTSIVPTLARLFLGMVFISLGWCQYNEYIDYSVEDAERLRALAVDIQGPGVDPAPTATPAAYSGEAQIRTASLVQDPEQQDPPTEEETEAQDPPAESGEATQDPPAEDTTAQDSPTELVDPATTEDLTPLDPSGVCKAQRMHRITLAVDSRGLGQWAKLISLGTVVAQMVAGILIVIGLFSRLCALVLVGAAGAAFYFSSMQLFNVVGNPLNLATIDHISKFNAMSRHMGTFLLALLVLLAGPGPLSLDRLLFRRDAADAGADMDLD
jgi:uncharacterized membrane protein YphA (DoxX/SURF4 family)